MEGIDDLDIYDDLDEFQEVQEKKSKELQDVECRYQESLKENALLQMENKQLQKKIKTLEVNFQNLLDTAKAEIRRKNLLIDELRKEKDDICFRRKQPTHNPFKNNVKIRQEELETAETRDEKRQPTNHAKETKIDTKKQNERKYEHEKEQDNYSRREDKHMARKDYRDRDRDRDRLSTRRSRSKERVTEHKSRDANLDARSILNSKVKRKQEYEHHDKEPKRSKLNEHQEEKHLNEKHVNGSSEPKKQERSGMKLIDDSVNETLKKVSNNIENIVEELKKEINELSKDNFSKKDAVVPDAVATNEQKDQHSFDDYLELFAETDLSDVETPVQTPLKKTENTSLNDLCEPIESDEEMEDIINFAEENELNKKNEKFQKERKHKSEPTRRTKRLSEEHKKLFGESEEGDENPPIVNSNEKRKEKDKLRFRSTHKTESFLRITITSPKRRKEPKEKVKVVKKVKVTDEAVEKKLIQKSEVHEENLTTEVVNQLQVIEKEKNKEDLKKIRENLHEDVKEKNKEIQEKMNEDVKENDKEIQEKMNGDAKEINREIREKLNEDRKENNKEIKENLNEDLKENNEEIQEKMNEDLKKKNKENLNGDAKEKNKEIKENLNEDVKESNKEIQENLNEDRKDTLMDTSIEDASVSKKLMDNIFSTDNNHSWLGFKIPKKTTKNENQKEEEEEKVVENNAKVPAKTRTRARRKVTVVKKLENSKENEVVLAETTKEDVTIETANDTTTKTDESDIISPKTSALLDEIFEKTANESIEKLAETEKTPQCSPKADDNEVEMRMRNIFQSPMNATVESNDRPTILSNITLANNTQILDLILEQSQNNPTTTTTLEQLPIDNQLSDLIVEQTQTPSNVDTSNLSEVSTTMNSSTETKEMVMGTSKYVFEKVSDNTVHLFITRNKNRRKKKVATQVNSPVVLPTMET